MLTFSTLSTVVWFIHILECMHSTLETPNIGCELVEKLDRAAVRMLIFKLYHTH